MMRWHILIAILALNGPFFVAALRRRKRRADAVATRTTWRCVLLTMVAVNGLLAAETVHQWVTNLDDVTTWTLRSASPYRSTSLTIERGVLIAERWQFREGADLSPGLGAPIYVSPLTHSTGVMRWLLPRFVSKTYRPCSIHESDVWLYHVSAVSLPLWYFVVPFMLAARAFVMELRRRLKIPDHCTTCGYDLRGTLSGRCSECGTSVVADAAVAHMVRQT